MNKEEKEIMTNQLKSFTRFVLELDVEEFIKENNSNMLMIEIAQETKKYQKALQKKIFDFENRYADRAIFIPNEKKHIALVNQYVKEQFGGIHGHN